MCPVKGGADSRPWPSWQKQPANMGALGFAPRAFRMQSGCDTATPGALLGRAVAFIPAVRPPIKTPWILPPHTQHYWGLQETTGDYEELLRTTRDDRETTRASRRRETTRGQRKITGGYGEQWRTSEDHGRRGRGKGRGKGRWRVGGEWAAEDDGGLRETAGGLWWTRGDDWGITVDYGRRR